jgi:lysophospholipase L1-like esterase
VAVVAIAVVCTACTSSNQKRSAVAGPAPPRRLYVAVGASETRGEGTDNPLRQAWPQDLFRTLPAGYSFVNLGIPGATVADALAEELPLAESLRPTLVTVWLNVNDLLGLVGVDRYTSELTELISGLRSTGATVLVANTPPLDELPAYLACEDPANHPGICSPSVPQPVPPPAVVDGAVDTYNAAIAGVVTEEGATLVDLHAADLAVRARGGEAALISADGFHPNAAGAQAVADQFAAVIAAHRLAG